MITIKLTDNNPNPKSSFTNLKFSVVKTYDPYENRENKTITLKSISVNQYGVLTIETYEQMGTHSITNTSFSFGNATITYGSGKNTSVTWKLIS